MCFLSPSFRNGKGGERPIGIFPSFVRVISRIIRYKYGRFWLQQNDRPFLYGRKGRSALQCVWRQAAICEHATYLGKVAIAILIDIIKAFDSVEHSVLFRNALKYNFSFNILRYLLSLYKTRLIVVQGVATTFVKATRSIVPGDSNADVLMTLAMLSAIDSMVQQIEVFPAVLADDVQFLAVGTSSECVAIAEQASSILISELEGEAMLAISTSKLMCISNSPSILGKFARRAPRFREAKVASGRNLGVDFAAGKPITRAVQKGRLKESKKRAKRLRQVKKAGGNVKTIVRTNLHACARYGVQVVGMLPSLLAGHRSDIHAALVDKPKGWSRTIDVMLGDRFTDPTYDCLVAPIVFFLAMLWNQSLPRDMIFRAWSTAVFKVDHGLTWKQAIGPFAIAALAFQKIGWKHTSLVRWIRPCQMFVDISALDPMTIEQMLNDDVQLMLFNSAKPNHTGYEQIQGLPFFGPINGLIRSKPTVDWTKQHQAMLRCIVADGCWPLQRLQTAGYVTDGLCVCGTLQDAKHAAWECALTAPGTRVE